MKQSICIFIWFFCLMNSAVAEQSGSKIVHFPKDHAVGRLKIRDTNSLDKEYRTLLSMPGWVLLDQAQGDVKVPEGKYLKLEVYGDVIDISFISKLKSHDLAALSLGGTNVVDEDFVHIKDLRGLLALNLNSMKQIDGSGLAYLVNLKSLKELSCFNTNITDPALEHISKLTSLKRLNLYVSQVNGPGLKYLKSLKSLAILDLAMTKISDDSLTHLSELTWLKELQLYDTIISDKGLTHLSNLHSLEVLILGALRLDSSPITDEGLAHLKGLRSLKNLYLYKTGITDAGLAHLSGLARLEMLCLNETQITGEGLAFLKSITTLTDLGLNQTNLDGKYLVNCKTWSNTLESLSLDETKVSDADMVHLSGLKALKYLGLSDTLITDDGLAHLQGLVSLKTISLQRTKITDAGLVHLKNLNSLESIYLENTQITDDGLMILKDLPNLNRISVQKTYVTNEGLEKFKQNCVSKSVEANVSRRLINTKKKGLTMVVVQSPQSEVKPPPLLGKTVPKLHNLNIELKPEQVEDKIILVCFFDMNQRPSRNCLMQLSRKTKELTAKDIVIVAIQASNVGQDKLNDWVKENNIPFPVGMIQGDEEKTRFTWGVRSLPWLILTDKKHIVTAEGFGLNELDEKLAGKSH
jgi:Leucine-rich repeat (LRR) protein